MTYFAMRSLRCVLGFSATLAAVAFVSGCGGDAGPEKYHVTGMVTYGGKPIGTGDVIFEPKEGLKNLQSMTRSRIKDGRYTAEIVGGTQTVAIRDLTGNFDMDPEGAKAGRRPLLTKEYRGDVDYPPISAVKEDVVTKDIEIPKKAR